MKTLFLVQHGQSHHHVNPDARRWPDEQNGLTPVGRRQVMALARRLASSLAKTDCVLYTSDMQRAQESADIIAAELGQDPTAVPDLREYNGHVAVHGLRRDRERRTLAPQTSVMDWRPFAQAETWREFYGRVADWMEHLRQEMTNGDLPVLVVHGGTLSNIVTWWLGLPIDALPERTPFAAGPGSLSVLTHSAHGNPVIERLNDQAHLYSTS